MSLLVVVGGEQDLVGAGDRVGVQQHDQAQAEPLALSQPTVSHHLKVLLDAGLVSRDKRGVWAYYRLVEGALTSLAELLTASTSATCSDARELTGSSR